jgi:hypothetical protein
LSRLAVGVAYAAEHVEVVDVHVAAAIMGLLVPSTRLVVDNDVDVGFVGCDPETVICQVRGLPSVGILT